MEKETTENQDSSTPEEESSDLDTEEKEEQEESEEQEETPESDTEESVDDLKAKLKKEKDLAKNYKIRAEKAEKAEKKAKERPEAPKPDMSSEDIYVLAEAKVNPDDISEVQDYAKLKKISIKEALASSIIRTLLAEKNEERKTAQATNTGSSKRSSKKLPDDTLLKKASKGELPEDPAELADARFREKKAK